MAKIQPLGGFRNVLLSRLSDGHLESIRPHLKPVELEQRQVIYRPNEEVKHAYFVESGMMSIVSIMDEGSSIEVGTIGFEGMTGGFLLLGVNSVPYRYFIQIAGNGYQMDAADLIRESERNSEFRELVLRNEAVFHTQTMQNAACNGLHSLQQRCCRWLLMSRDRVYSDKLSLTHEFLGLMLGVRRASVTDVLRPLQDRGWIESHRGEITILDRQALETGCCECYRIVADEQKHLLN
jgi:CRP-like cAMP-binding protein